ELRRLVVDDAAESSELEHFAGERLAVEVLGARSLQTQRAARTLGGCDPLAQRAQHGVKARAHAALSSEARQLRVGQGAVMQQHPALLRAARQGRDQLARIEEPFR